MLLALDSTDSPAGGCTTHVSLETWRGLEEFDVRQAPRLVRLNPNIPYKTRGNGALCLDIGHGRGRRRRVAHVRGVDLFAAEELDEPDPREQRRILEVAAATVEEFRSTEAASAVALLGTPPDPRWYERTVTEWVAYHTEDPPMSGTLVRTWGDGRGLVGARAAAAWPGKLGTWELIAYRERGRWGTNRKLSPVLGTHLDESYPNTFDNWDPRHRHLRIAPRSPCPILAGVRGTSPGELLSVVEDLGPEQPESWCLFATNQATGDHLRPATTANVRAFDSVIVEGEAVADPHEVRGGHVFLRVRDEEGEILCAAYEPTKEFRHHVRAVRAGDRVRVEAAAHEDPRRLSLEALEWLDGAERTHFQPPLCPACERPMASRGRRGGYRCDRCDRRLPASSARAASDPHPGHGRQTVPIAVRRHLSRPESLQPSRLDLTTAWGPSG